MGFEAWVTVVVCTGWLTLFGYLLMGLRSEEELPKREARPRRCEGLVHRSLAAAQALGVTIMTVLDDALARVTTFVKDVVAQLTAARDTNDTQTGKLAELQVALDAALSDDAADKTAITTLQAEISSLQEAVAAQINAAVDALQAVPAPVEEAVAAEVAEETVVEETVVEEPVTEVAGETVE